MLYTRKGDTGKTKIFACNQSFSKSSTIAEALGDIDELNSYLGLCYVEIKTKSDFILQIKNRNVKLEKIIRDVQENLFIVQAEVAGAKKKINKTKVKRIENIIDAIEKELPKITNFSISGGTRLSAMFDFARAVARRAERRVVATGEEGKQKISKNTFAYLNRLSSLLFALARYANHLKNVSEETPKYK